MVTKNVYIMILVLFGSCTPKYDYQEIKIDYGENSFSISSNEFVIDSISIFDMTRQYYTLSKKGIGLSIIDIDSLYDNYLISNNLDELDTTNIAYLFVRIAKKNGKEIQFFNTNFSNAKKQYNKTLRAERTIR